MKTNKKSYISPELFYIEKKQDEGACEEEYCKVVNHFIFYYHKRAQVYKIWYLGLNVFKLILLALIPISQTFSVRIDLAWLVTASSSFCILLESVTKLFLMRNKWLLYRKTETYLMHEKRKYATGTGVYAGRSDPDKFNIFVYNVESILGNESSDWYDIAQSIQEKTKGAIHDETRSNI